MAWLLVTVFSKMREERSDLKMELFNGKGSGLKKFEKFSVCPGLKNEKAYSGENMKCVVTFARGSRRTGYFRSPALFTKRMRRSVSHLNKRQDLLRQWENDTEGISEAVRPLLPSKARVPGPVKQNSFKGATATQCASQPHTVVSAPHMSLCS